MKALFAAVLVVPLVGCAADPIEVRGERDDARCWPSRRMLKPMALVDVAMHVMQRRAALNGFRAIRLAQRPVKPKIMMQRPVLHLRSPAPIQRVLIQARCRLAP